MQTRYLKKLNELVQYFHTDDVAFGAMFLLPNGDFLDISLLTGGHAEFSELSGYSISELKEKGWIRLNTKLRYIDLSGVRITSAQVNPLKRVVAFMGGDIQLKLSDKQDECTQVLLKAIKDKAITKFT